MKKKAPVFWIFGRIRRWVPAILLLIAVTVGNSLLNVTFALGTQQVIDTAVSKESDAFVRACFLQGTIILGILLSATLSRHLTDRLSAELDRDWKKSLLHGLLHGDYAAISKFHSGELVNRLNNDVRTVDDGILTILPSIAGMIMRLVAASSVLIYMEPLFAVLVLLAGIVVIMVSGFMRKRLKNLSKRVSEEDGKVSGFIQETLEKLLMVQAMDVSREMERRSDTIMEDRFQIQRKKKNVSIMANTCINLMYLAAGFAALVWCSVGLLHGRITFGTLTAVIQLVNQLQIPFSNLSGVVPKYIAMSASAERLMELEALEREPAPIGEDPRTLYNRATGITAKNLCFSYEREPVLHQASFTLPKGVFAAIIGPSGIGKSTLLKLLLGVFRPESGQLYLDTDSESVALDRSTRRLFAYVPQGNLLFSGTLRENLTVTNPDATEAEIRQALYVSAMDEYLPQLPLGLDTRLGENGAGLSEGQAQRLAIARAILSGAPVLLLDESTSALDARTEQIVLERIRELSDRTCIAVTHRPAALDLCDWQLEMRNGKIQASSVSHNQ